jgi:hypothetical protein
VTSSLFNGRNGLLLFCLAACACGQNRRLNVTVSEGAEFEHRLQLPGSFRESNLGDSRVSFDHYAFRATSSSPDVLLLTACKFDVADKTKSLLDEEICSPNAFAIDAGHLYAVRAVELQEWDKATPIPGYFHLENPYERRPNEYMRTPADLKPVPFPPDQRVEREGFRYRGKTYARRGPWLSLVTVGDSADGRILVLGGADKRTLPDPGKVFLGNPIMGGTFGTFTVDIFDTDSGSRLAAVDAACQMNVMLCMRRANLANSRWFAIALEGSLQSMVLLDFKSRGTPVN